MFSFKRICLLIPILLFILFLISYFFTNQFDQNPKVKTFYDQNNQLIGSLYPKNGGIQIWKPFSEIPDSVIQETIKREDRYFYYHLGFNPVAISKAVFSNYFLKNKRRGASTITQQLAKILIEEKTDKLLKRNFENKIKEAILAFGLEIKYSKKWILERYLNSIYYGKRAYGIEGAAYRYFRRSTKDLSNQEIRQLVQLPQNPSVKSKKHIAFKMTDKYARHYRQYVSQVYSHLGPVIHTTLKLDVQIYLEKAAGFFLNDKKDSKKTGAVVVIDVKTGDVLAMVGSKNYFDDSIDGKYNAAMSLRQPGSTLKPFTYFAAFMKGYHPETYVPDIPVSIGDTQNYLPQNFDRKYRGLVSIKEALANSYNIPAVLTLNEVGLSFYHEILKKFGFTTFNHTPNHYGLAMTLGSGEVRLIELVNAYAALARGGSFLKNRFIKNEKISDLKKVDDKAQEHAEQITNILSNYKNRLKTFGANENLMIDGYPIAVKTGTSSLHRDNWTVGYSPEYAVGVWVGHADGSSLLETTGASGAAPLWHAVMETLVRKTKESDFLFSEFKNENKNKILKNKSYHSDWQITSPLENTQYRIVKWAPIEHQKILAEVKSVSIQPKKIKWYLDSQFIDETEISSHGIFKKWIEAKPGKHELELISENGKSQKISFYVMEKT